MPSATLRVRRAPGRPEGRPLHSPGVGVAPETCRGPVVKPAVLESVGRGVEMMKTAAAAVLTSLAMTGALGAQQLSAKWEELTAADFAKALQQSRNTCALPFGILEKHGPAGVL